MQIRSFYLLCEFLDISEVLVQISINVGQLDDVGSVASLKVFADDFTETFLSFAFAVLWTHSMDNFTIVT